MKAIPTDNQAIEKEILQLLASPKQFEKGFSLLVATYSQAMYWSIRRMVFNHDDADDVLQNTLMKVYKNIEKFKGNSKLYTWLYRIAMNESITFINQQKKKATTSLSDPNINWEQGLRADEFWDGNKAELLLQQALATLPEKQREVFNLRYFDEMTYQNMADLLGKSIGGLKANYHHALKKIEDYIKTHIE